MEEQQGEYLSPAEEDSLIQYFIDELLKDAEDNPSEFLLEKYGVIEPKSAEKPPRTTKPLPSANKPLRRAYENIRMEFMKQVNGGLEPSGILDSGASYYRLDLPGIKEPRWIQARKLKQLLKDYIINVGTIPAAGGFKVYSLIRVPRQLLLDNCE